MRRSLASELLAISIMLVVGAVALGWNLSLVQHVFANSESDTSVTSLSTEIALLRQSINSAPVENASTDDLQGRIEGLPTKHGVVVKSLRRWERVAQRSSTQMVTLELESSYGACVAALQDIERWSEVAVSDVTVKQSADNNRFVILSVILAIQDEEA